MPGPQRKVPYRCTHGKLFRSLLPSLSLKFPLLDTALPLAPKSKTNKQKVVIPWGHLSHTQFRVLQWKLAWPWWKQGRLTPNPGFHLPPPRLQFLLWKMRVCFSSALNFLPHLIQSLIYSSNIY